MFIWEVFRELFECPDKKFHLLDEDEQREYVISTDYNMGIEPHYIIYECFRNGDNIGSTVYGGFDGNIPIHSDDWEEVEEEMTKEVTKEVKYYVTYKLPQGIEELTSSDRYLNYAFGAYFFGSNCEFSDYKVTFTRDEIEEFGIAHPEVRREDLEFIEVVE